MKIYQISEAKMKNNFFMDSMETKRKYKKRHWKIVPWKQTNKNVIII